MLERSYADLISDLDLNKEKIGKEIKLSRDSKTNWDGDTKSSFQCKSLLDNVFFIRINQYEQLLL